MSIKVFREPDLPAHWYLRGCITGSNGFDYAYSHRALGSFTIQRMGKNTKKVGADWRVFCGDALVSETRFKTASKAAAHADQLIAAVVPGILPYLKLTGSVAGVEQKFH